MKLRNLSLVTPFAVLALAVVSLATTPLLVQRRSNRLRLPAVESLAKSVRAIGHLVDMRVQLHRYILSTRPGGEGAAAGAREALDESFGAYAVDARPGAGALISALPSLENAALSAQASAATEHLTELLMTALADETRRAGLAATNLEQVRGRALHEANLLDLAWALVAALGGGVAAWLVHRHQRIVAQVRLLEQERALELEQFSARVAHDIVSPLAPVAIGARFLAEKLRDDPQAQRAAELMRRSLDRVALIVDDLLRFARAGARAEPGEAADLQLVMEALREELLPAAQQSGIALTFEPAPRVQVACAEGAILVVLQNLIRNAIKYIGEGPRRLIVARAVLVASGVRLIVQDSGPGIPAGMELSVFDPYVRAPGAREPGIGLGLATVKRIVEAHRGRVGVSSEPRKGATFWVDLPLAAKVA